MNFFSHLSEDIRFQEGLKGCIHCGTCTAICPAAGVCDYDPRIITDIVQHKNNKEIENLLKGDMIWYCGECLSCKTRCPRGNTPAYIIQALRALSVETGLFTESLQGQKQLAIKRTVGDHILEYGYCVYIDEVDTDMFPEQGPIWDWYKKNRVKVLERLGANYQKPGKGTLRKVSEESLLDLQRIFDETGGSKRFAIIEEKSKEKAQESGFDFEEGKDAYFLHLFG